jgi:hypothetical protein
VPSDSTRTSSPFDGVVTVPDTDRVYRHKTLLNRHKSLARMVADMARLLDRGYEVVRITSDGAEDVVARDGLQQLDRPAAVAGAELGIGCRRPVSCRRRAAAR